MTVTTNVDLLKEYIKTLIATEIVFPGVLPRKWGTTFSSDELEAIYLCLNTIIQMADPITYAGLIEEFAQVNDKSYLHGFLCSYWRSIVRLVNDLPVYAHQD
ncbi:hypothetical protein [Spirosoma gilvum]